MILSFQLLDHDTGRLLCDRPHPPRAVSLGGQQLARKQRRGAAALAPHAALHQQVRLAVQMAAVGQHLLERTGGVALGAPP